MRQRAGAPLAGRPAFLSTSRILVVVQDTELGASIASGLGASGHEVTTAQSGRSGLDLCARVHPEAAIVDLSLPDMSGLDVCRTIRSSPMTATLPIIVLTARPDEVDRVVALQVDADDVVSSPVSVREIALRLRAVLRRAFGQKTDAHVLERGGLCIDVGAHRATLEGKDLRLSVREFRLLAVLVKSGERVLDRSALLDMAWGTDVAVDERSVDAYVTRLRRKLGPLREMLETVHGVGYRFKTR